MLQHELNVTLSASLCARMNIELMDPKTFAVYARLCGAVPALPHARSGDPAQVGGYIGSSDVFDQAIADFAEAYADQAECDRATLVAAIQAGHVQTETVV